MKPTVALVACVKKKAKTPRPARNLYISDWFKKASAYAEMNSDSWYILSAKYYLVEPDEVIAPYCKTLKQMTVAERRAWADMVIPELGKILKPGYPVIILAGVLYREHLIGPIKDIGCTIEIPMKGLGIGQQLGWLKDKLTRQSL